MSLGGTFTDAHKDVFMQTYLHEAQDKGSILEQVVMKEFMEGNKTFFTKMGKKDPVAKTSRLQERDSQLHDYERRHMEYELAEYFTHIDIDEIIKNISNPRADIIQAAVKGIGRFKDDIIMEAIAGSAAVTTNGTASNQALTLSVAVNDHTYDSGSADVGLTVSKLKKAQAELLSNYGASGGDRMILVAPAKQIMNLTQDDQFTSNHYRSGTPLEGPGVMTNVSGFMGIDFIGFERTGVDANGDEKAFLLTEDAIKMGIYAPLEVDVFPDKRYARSPDAIAVSEGIGATRMYEEKVVEILCNPIA